MDWPIVVLALGALGVIIWFVRRLWDSSSDTNARQFAETGYSVWTWRGGRWQLTDDRSRPGHVPGPEPSGTGRQEGVSVRVGSVRR